MLTINELTLEGFITFLFVLVLLLFNFPRKIRRPEGHFKTAPRKECIRTSGGDPDIIIVGAGVAGAALAYTLGKDGRRVQVIERDLTEPDRIMGELLQPGGYLKLIELGMEDCLIDIDAQQVFGYDFYNDGKHIKLSYPLERFSPDTAGRCFRNGRFIQKLREKAATLTNVRLEQGTVTSLAEENGIIKGVHYKTKDGEEITVYAPLTIVCDGSFSNLRRSLCTPQVDVPSSFVGLLLENCDLPFANHGLVIVANPSPIILFPISSTEIRCLVDIPGKKVPSVVNGEMANYLMTVVAPQILPQLYDPFIAAIKKGNIRTMRNKRMHANPHPTPGALLIGDALNMRHPLTGGGMTVALSDIVIVRDLLRPVHDLNVSANLCKHLESFYTLRKPMASIINIMAAAMHKVFLVSSDPLQKVMLQVFWDYLSLGKICSSGMVALLSGLDPRPVILFLHFFAAAIYGAGRLLLPFPSPRRIWLVARLLSVSDRQMKYHSDQYSSTHLNARDNNLPFTMIGYLSSFFPDNKSRGSNYTNILPCDCSDLLQNNHYYVMSI